MLFYFSDTEVMLNSNVHFGTQTVTRGQTEGDHFQFTVQSLCDNSSWDTVNSWNVAAIKILFFKYLRNKNNPGVNYKQVFIKVVSKETHACHLFLTRPVNVCHLLTLDSKASIQSTSIFHFSLLTVIQRLITGPVVPLSAKTIFEVLLLFALLGTSLSSAAICPLSI